MHRLAPIVALAVALALAGCTAPTPQTSPPSRESPGTTTSTAAPGVHLALSDFRQENPSCDDTTQFRVMVRNTGTEDAASVHFAASTNGRGNDSAQELGTIPAGAMRDVAASVEVHDTCGVEDRYPLTLTATPTNGAPATLSVEIST